MLQLSEIESKIISELQFDGKQSVKVISRRLGFSHEKGYKAIRGLLNIGAVKRVKSGEYEVLIDSYVVIKEPEKKESTNQLDTSGIPTNIKNYIIANAHVPRSNLSRKLNIPKILVNQVLMEAK